LLKALASGNIRRLKTAIAGTERETSMYGRGKPSLCKPLVRKPSARKASVWIVAGLAAVSGVLLLPREASAQFNIEGIVRGALQQQGCCYGGGGYRYRGGSGYSGHRATSHNNNANAGNDATPPDKSKEKDATQLEAPNTAVAGRQQLSGPAPATSRPADPDVPTQQTSAPRVNDDQPSFTPAR
jgi:hypothetical protein